MGIVRPLYEFYPESNHAESNRRYSQTARFGR